jgi:uncharacterized iron-regulated membrane protein
MAASLPDGNPSVRRVPAVALGQTIAGLASLGGVVLVWTGLALTWRRFRAWRARSQEHESLAA